MIKVGKIETTDSLIYRSYEVIELEGGLYAGIDAFSWPDIQHDLRAMECLVLPGEWRWTERCVQKDPEAGEPKRNKKGKYHLIKGAQADLKLQEVLSRHETGILCLQDQKYPYAIPMNHAFRNGKLYMHCGKKGHKVQLIQNTPNACYTLYGLSKDTPAQVRSCHLPYESIVFYGRIRIAQDPQEIEDAIREISQQYGTPYQHGFSDMIYILAFEIDHATIRDGRFKPNLNRNLYYWEPEKRP